MDFRGSVKPLILSEFSVCVLMCVVQRAKAFMRFSKVSDPQRVKYHYFSETFSPKFLQRRVK